MLPDKDDTAKMSSPTLPSPGEVPAASCLSSRSFKSGKCVFLTCCLGVFQFVVFALALRALGFALDFREREKAGSPFLPFL